MCVEFDVFHDGQFWVGVLTLGQGSLLRASKVVFGAEPSDAELYNHLLRHGYQMLERAEAGPAVAAGTRPPPTNNPKRAAREAAAQAKVHGSSTVARDAIRQAQEAEARGRDQTRRRASEEAAEYRRAVRRAKAKARHRGR
jgi:hypothetical protein